MFRFALPALLCLLAAQLSAQDCYDYYKRNCGRSINGRFPYTVNNSSVSSAFAPGESKCFYGELIQGKDYCITICSDSLYNGVVALLIRNDEGKILYDNSQDNFNVNIEFSCRKTNSVEYILTVPRRSDVDEKTKGCVGMLIEEMVTPQIGF